jgi:hypothetical protein
MTKQADAIRAALLACRTKDGKLTSSAVVETARKNKTSLLGRQFEWDDRKAAEEQRRQRAGELIRTYITVERVIKATRYTSVAYVKDPNIPAQKQGYMSLSDATRDDARRIIISEIGRCEQAIGRARDVAGVLATKFPGAIEQLEDALALLINTRARLLAA